VSPGPATATVVVGAQWGDEGKGKIVDLLAESFAVVARYQGGNNAGHTVQVGDETFKFRLLPSGILFPGKLCVLGNGVVLDPEVLCEELDELAARGRSDEGLRISGNAHLVMPWHRVLDQAQVPALEPLLHERARHCEHEAVVVQVDGADRLEPCLPRGIGDLVVQRLSAHLPQLSCVCHQRFRLPEDSPSTTCSTPVEK
jgi:hypothetical protein